MGTHEHVNAQLAEPELPKNYRHFINPEIGAADQRIRILDNFISVESLVNIERSVEILLSYGADFWDADMFVCCKCLEAGSSDENDLYACDMKNCNNHYHVKCMEKGGTKPNRKLPWFCFTCTKRRSSCDTEPVIESVNVTELPSRRPRRNASITATRIKTANCEQDLFPCKHSADNETIQPAKVRKHE